MNLIESKSLLAKLMATEDLTVEQRNVSTAFFDVKNRILTVPVLDKNISSQLYDLFMGHEVGHALYTPLEGLQKSKEDKINMSVLNVVEDSRIERKIKYKYPGLKNSFYRAYQELVEKDFFEVNDKDINKLNFIDRVNLHCKVGAVLAIKFNEEERKLLKEVESTETFEQVVDVTKRITDFMELVEKECEQTEPGDDNENGEDLSDLEDPSEGSNLDPKGEKTEEKSNKNSSEESSEQGGNKSPESSPQDENQTGDEKQKAKKQKSSGKGKEEIRSETDDAYRKNESQLFSKDDDIINYANIPNFKAEDVIFDYKDVYKLFQEEGWPICKNQFEKFRRDSNKVVSYLVKEFEMRKNADQLKRASVAKTGELNMNRLFSYQFNEDLFKKVSVIPGGKSHGLVMFIDWSGSMVRHLGNTVKQLLNLVMFCKKVNIPFEVYCFTESTVLEHVVNIPAKRGDLVINGFGLVNLLSSRMSAKEFSYAGAALMYISGLDGTYNSRPRTPSWIPLSGTPLNESIIAAMEIIPHFQKKNNLQIVNAVFLTDGDGNFLNGIYHDDAGRYQDTHWSGRGYNSKKISRVVFRDPKTKNEEYYEVKSWVRTEQTTALIKLLKARTNCNIIGFYLAHGRDYRDKINQFFPTNADEVREQTKKDRYCVVTNAGFDEYYLLRSEAMDTDDAGELVVKENATTRGIVSAFNKYAGSRVQNRVVLNRFINLIT
jgi:hypothetical protein